MSEEEKDREIYGLNCVIANLQEKLRAKERLVYELSVRIRELSEESDDQLLNPSRNYTAPPNA